MNLTAEELLRYSRHFALPNFGLEAQLKLKNASVLVVGAGGLGCPALLYLNAAGVGRIGIIDFDTVSISNLQRQVLFHVDDLGKNKALVAKTNLAKRNPLIAIDTYTFKINSQNALEILAPYDIIIDASDNFPTRYLICDASIILNKPIVYGAVHQFEGHVAVFNLNKSPTYRDLHPIPPDMGVIQNCEQEGVLGTLTGIIGTLLANETIKILAQIGNPLNAELLLINSQTLEFIKIQIPEKGQRKLVTQLIDYDYFCEGSKPKAIKTMKEVTVQELKAMKDANQDFQLIDVREPHEYDICEIGGELIPMAEVPFNLDKISRTKQVIVHCRSGKRSGDTIQWLEQNQQFTNLFNLKGGILAWAKEIDTTMETY